MKKITLQIQTLSSHPHPWLQNMIEAQGQGSTGMNENINTELHDIKCQYMTGKVW